jgi:hypothetical protein
LSALIGGKFICQKNPLQDLLSSLKPVTSTTESTQIKTVHVIYNPAYTYKFQLKTTADCSWSEMKASLKVRRQYFVAIPMNTSQVTCISLLPED